MHSPLIHAAPTERAPARLRLGIVALVAAFEAVHLAVEHLRGGIASHHLLADPTLPELWNGWGLVLLPLLAWYATGRAFSRAGLRWRLHRPFAWRVAGGLLVGLALASAFELDAHTATRAVFGIAIVGGIALRAYRLDLALGFALGMAYTFGGVLPVLIGSAIAVLSAVLWLGVVPVLRWTSTLLRRPQASTRIH